MGRLARADGEGQEIDVITDGLRLAIAHAVKLLEAVPRERAVTLKRTWDALQDEWRKFLCQSPEARTKEQCKALMRMVAAVQQVILT